MKKTILCISFLLVFISFFDFFRDGNIIFFDEPAEIENTDIVEDCSSADEEDDKELINPILFTVRYSFHYGSSHFIPHSLLFELHSPPPEV